MDDDDSDDVAVLSEFDLQRDAGYVNLQGCVQRFPRGNPLVSAVV